MSSPAPVVGRGTGLLAAVVLCVLSVTFASACSTAEIADQLGKARYIAQMKVLIAQVRTDAQSLRTDVVDKGKSVDQVVGTASADLAHVKARLEEINPPSQIAALHDQLTGVVGQLSGVFSSAQQSLRSGDLGQLLALAPQAQDLASQVGQLTQDFAQEGYRIQTGPRDGG